MTITKELAKSIIEDVVVGDRIVLVVPEAKERRAALEDLVAAADERFGKLDALRVFRTTGAERISFGPEGTVRIVATSQPYALRGLTVDRAVVVGAGDHLSLMEALAPVLAVSGGEIEWIGRQP